MKTNKLKFALLAFVALISNVASAQDDLRICYKVTPWDGAGTQCGGALTGCSGYGSNASYTPAYIDNTDERRGGCSLSWSVESPAKTKNRYRVCREVTPGGDDKGECGGTGVKCSGWNDAPAFSSSYIDDTDERGGWCRVRYSLEEEAHDTQYVFRVCYKTVVTTGGDGQQCGANLTGTFAPEGCSGWSDKVTYSPFMLDDTDDSAGGCSLTWKIERKVRDGFVFPQCNDGKDNDGDGAIDYPNDYSCASTEDNDETNPKSACQDGLDNDADGLIDIEDPGCTSSQDNNEGDGTSQCQDGIDNDNDGAIDYPNDASCSSPKDKDEGDPKTQCQDGLDNDADGLIDLIDPGCANSQDNDESNTITPTCTNASTTEIKTQLDSAAYQLSQLTDQAADRLAKTARGSLTGASLRTVETDAQRAKAKAQRFMQRVNELLLTFPDVLKLCPTSSTTCSSTDRSTTITQLQSLYRSQLAAIKRITARRYFKGTSSTNQTGSDKIVSQAKTVYESGNAALATLPPVETVCK